jgi:glucose/arabinose dehydrogenase
MKIRLLTLAILLLALAKTERLHAQSKLSNRADSTGSVLTGANAFASYSTEKPGTRRKLTVADLPQPYATESADNHPRLVPRPSNAWPQALPGFKVELYASGLRNPRLLRAAPNGDIFVAESDAGEIKVLRGIDKNGKAEQQSVFATGLKRPFGIAFYPPGRDPQWIYIGNTDSVIRFPYANRDLKARGPAQIIVPRLPSGARVGGGGHWTRDVIFSKEGSKMYVSVGSRSNVDDPDTHPPSTTAPTSWNTTRMAPVVASPLG